MREFGARQSVLALRAEAPQIGPVQPRREIVAMHADLAQPRAATAPQPALAAELPTGTARLLARLSAGLLLALLEAGRISDLADDLLHRPGHLPDLLRGEARQIQLGVLQLGAALGRLPRTSPGGR